MTVQDAEQRRRALSPEASFIVQAPAGSGKTELLIQRCLVLLARVQRPESVVAITFTIKAADEMRRRLLSALQDAGGPPPEAEHKRQTWDLARAVRERDAALGWDILGNPHRLEIRTIDSLCSVIVRRMPWVSRMGPPPDILENAEELYSEAARETVALVEDDRFAGPLGCLLMHLDNNVPVLQNMLVRMLGRRDQWLRHIGYGVDRDAARAALEQAIENAVIEAIEEARDTAPEFVIDDLPALADYAAGNLDPACTSPILACGGMGRFPLPVLDELPQWLGIADLLLTKNDPAFRKKVDRRTGFPPNGKAVKNAMEGLLESLAAFDAFAGAMHALRSLPEPRYTEAQWAVVDALLTVLPVAVAQLAVVFQTRGQIDFTEVLLAAQRALGSEDEPTDLGLAFDYRIEHLLVDEFQDTSITQCLLLQRLTAGWTPGDGRTLFLVGDPMQSIYRFREADVSLFLRATEDGLGSVALEKLKLSVNFRSQSGIVDWINGAFRNVLPERDDPASGAVAFSPSVANKPAGSDPAVQVHAFLGKADEKEAAEVLDLVREPCGKTTAILVRARTHLPSILWKLRENGIRYRAVDIDCLGELPVIQDLLALTCALLHPADRIAWLSILRAPWCGLTLAEMEALVGDSPHAIVAGLLDDARLTRIPPAAAGAVRRVRDAVASSLARSGRPLRDLVEGAWVALGGPACLTGAQDLENARAFFELLEGIDDGGDADLDLLRGKVASLFAAPDPAADESLQVMTIHKAKGLEFDRVIVPGLGRPPRRPDPELLVWEERSGEPEGELLIAPVKGAGQDTDLLYKFVNRFDVRKSEHETARLLYVACTRAKERLHLLGAVKLDRNGGPCNPDASSFLRCLWPAVHLHWAGVAAPVQDGNASEAPPSQVLRRLPAGWSPTDPPHGLALPPVPEPEDDLAPEPSFDWVRDTLRRVGTVVHGFLVEIASEGSAAWDVERVRALRPRIEAALSGLGIAPGDLPGAADTVQKALETTLQDKHGCRILGSHWSEAANEVALTGIFEGRLITARVDRTYVDHTGTRWIVDYKTSSHEGAGLDEFLDNECRRYREPMRRYRELWALHDPRPVRTALYFPLIGAWREVS